MNVSVREHNQTFQTLQRIIITTLIGAFLLNGLLVYYILSQKGQSDKKVYVVTDNGTYTALQQENRIVSVHEARNHIRTFLHTMFAHTAADYRQKVENGLHLIDKGGGQRILHDFTKGEVYENYVRLGTYTTLNVDSITLDMNQRPFAGRAYARQTIHLGENQKAFPIGIAFELTETYRSDENPYGLLITAFDYVPYPLPSTEGQSKPTNP